ncbi:MAG: hypothetical protein KDB27_00815 [Planctomycetales bacterium]|nr:hypothetical protein [Planctomycetales bacterium]
MNDLNKQVHQARRRLNFQRFLSVVFWSLSGALLVAAIGLAIPKIWALSIDPQIWQGAWLGGALVVGLAVAFVWSYLRRQSDLDAAIEIDRRYGLKERVSSCLSLTEQESETQAGQALINDAARRVANVDVKERFQVAPNRWAFLPVVLAGIVFAITFIADAELNESKEANAATVQSTKRVKKSTAGLKKKLNDQQKKALEKRLDEAKDIFKKIEAGVDRLQSRNKIDKKDALVKLNDFSEELKQRAKQLGDPSKLKQQLSQLRDLKEGPAEKIARSMKNGDFKNAIEAVRDLQQQLQSGKLSEEQQKQLAEQLQQMQQKLQQMADAQEALKQDLQKQIEQKLASGDRKGAADLQKKLDNMNSQNSQMNSLRQMAQKMGQMQKSLQEGNPQDAANQLSQLAEDLEGMQQELDELEMLEGALDQIADAKNSMNCEGCNGEGCSMCQGNMLGDGGLGGMSEMPGNGMGEGQGQGDRPESETNTGFYDSQVAAKPGKGKAVIIGSAGGPNKPGQAFEEIRQQFEAAKTADDDPLTGSRLPKAQRELTKQYFNQFRE